MMPCKVMGQASLYSQDDITITSGTVITIQGDFFNRPTAIVNNSGTMEIAGDMICTSTNDVFGTSQGTVVLNGTTNQLVGGIMPITFNNLTLSNTGSKSLFSDIVVGGSYVNPAGVLSVGSCRLRLSGNTMTITNPLASAITYTTGGIISESNTNQSIVTWKIGANSGNYTVPFSNLGGAQFIFAYNILSGTANDVSMSTYGTIAANTPLPTTPVAVTHIRNNAGLDNSANMVNRYWHIATTGDPVADFRFNWPVSENPANGTANLRGQNWNAPQISWNIPFGGQTNPDAQSVIVPGVSDFNHGTWTVALDASPLPIELLSFTAIPEDNSKVRCDWITASEINNDYFTVERSKDGMHFEPIGIVDGSGTTTDVHSYFHYDMHPYSGLSYYRLMQTDFDGLTTHSQIVAVRLEGRSNMAIYPTLVNDYITIQSSESNNIQFALYAADGRLVRSEELIATNEGVQEFRLMRGAIASGIYFARTTDADGNTFTQKLIFK